jgi:hypothetical protein
MPSAVRQAEVVWQGTLAPGENHTPPERMTVTGVCTLDEIDGAPRITAVELIVRTQVPGLDKEGRAHNAAGTGQLDITGLPVTAS